MAIGSPLQPTKTNPHQQTRGDISDNQVRRVTDTDCKQLRLLTYT